MITNPTMRVSRKRSTMCGKPKEKHRSSTALIARNQPGLY